MKQAEAVGSPGWNDEMYSRHRTPYGKTLAGFVQAKRVKRVLAYAKIKPGDRVLEIGCESGMLCAAVPPCARLVGCDISAKALADAERLLLSKRRSAEFLRHDALQPLPFRAGEFDVIICSEMLEHVTDPRLVVANVAEICNAATRVILTVPLETPKLIAKDWLEKFGLFRVLFPEIERGQSEWHLQSFSKRLLREITQPLLSCEMLSSVCGCHVVGRFRRISR